MQQETLSQEKQDQISLVQGLKVFEILESTNLNWSVRKEDLISVSGLETPNSGIYRNDTNEWLGTTSKKYTPYQNAELVTTIVEASEHIGLEIAKGGILSKGKLVYVQMELKEEFIGNSQIKRYITALNSHNGTSSIGFGSSNEVVVCQNSFFKIYKELAKFRHTQSASEKIKLAVMELKNTIMEDINLMNTFKLMDSVSLTDHAVHDLIKSCFGIDIDKKEDLKKRTTNKLDLITEAINIELDLEGKTMWGLFNGVTRYTNHYASKNSPTKTKEDYIMNGIGYNVNLNAYDTILGWIESNTKETIPTI
jgi:hypothetical protein